VRRMAAYVLVLATVGVACGSPEQDGASGGSSLEPGDSVPEFSLPAADGARISPSDFRGTSTLFYFSMGPG
jgi:hypothetical protein